MFLLRFCNVFFFFFLRMRVLAGRCWLGRGISFLMSFFHVGVAIDELISYCVWHFSRYLDLSSIDLIVSLLLFRYQSITSQRFLISIIQSK